MLVNYKHGSVGYKKSVKAVSITEVCKISLLLQGWFSQDNISESFLEETKLNF